MTQRSTTQSDPQRVVVVGAGILGCAMAWQAARRGHQVTLVERHVQTQEATTRNFGMVWPIGQPSGWKRSLAMLSRSQWIELAREAGFWLVPCGSLHLAHHDDEWELLKQFVTSESELASDNTSTSSNATSLSDAATPFEPAVLIDPIEAIQKSPGVRREGLRGALWSSNECVVNPREVPGRIVDYLRGQHGVEFLFQSVVVEVGSNRIRLSSAHWLDFDTLIIASGSEMQLLFPQALAQSGLKRCKLQMLRTRPQPNQWRLNTHLASGLTLRHYQSFAHCGALEEVKRRVHARAPELDQFGIHVMASQNESGGVILGDSHEYDDQIVPYDKTLIDELMLRELRMVFDLPDWSIEERWSGIYVKHPERPFVWMRPQDNVHLLTGLGGAGMTLSQGIAKLFWDNQLKGLSE